MKKVAKKGPINAFKISLSNFFTTGIFATMQNEANVSLSPLELELVCNASWIYAKNNIIQKVCRLFGNLSAVYPLLLPKATLPEEVMAPAPKIARGEQYQGLPYVMLDYPRFFTRTDVCAIRTFLWWGHTFSITLHLKGVYKQQYLPVIANALRQPNFSDAWLYTGTDEWMHHVEVPIWKRVPAMGATDLAALPVTKIQFNLPLQQWKETAFFLEEKFKVFAAVLQAG